LAYECYTLIVVPHAKARFRKIQIPVRLAKWASGVLAACAIVVAAIVVDYLWIRSEVYELRRLRTENASLSEKTRVYEQNVGRLQARVSGLQKLVDKLGVMAGAEPAAAEPSGGVGGLTQADTQAPMFEPALAVRSMEGALSNLADRSAKLEAFYADRSLLLASTPSVWPVRGYLSSSFGNRLDPFTGQRDFHTGIDISTPIGTKVHAPADGVVVHCAEKGGYGKSIIINHGYGMVTRYGHLDGYNVKPGQRVRRGDVIGFVGNTGRSAAPHLHYEVWISDKAQNPIHFILDEYRSFG
jgi:murein DD-endopeptidase MepM/ murein hydrolase activator NlpD